MRRLMTSIYFAASALLMLGGPALAANPHPITGTTGQPGAINGTSCEDLGTLPFGQTHNNSTQSPYNNSSKAYAGTFPNPTTTNKPAPGVNGNAVSEYDVACLQHSLK